MGGFASIVRGALAGLNEAAGNQQTAQQLEAVNERARQDKVAQLRSQVAPHAIAIQGLQTRLQGIDPNQNPQEYAALTNEIQQNLAAVRGILSPEKNPQGNIIQRAITDPLHITSQQGRVQKEADRRAQGVAQDEQSAQAIARGAVPYMETPQYKQTQAIQAQRTADALKEIEARNAASGWTSIGQPVQVGDQWMQPFKNKAGETKMEPMPAGYSGPSLKSRPLSQYAQQRQSFAQSLGKTPETMTWQDEQDFLRQRYNANQPNAQRKLNLEEQKLHIAQASLNLRRDQNDWKDFQDTFKQLSPIEKLQTTANLSKDYVKNPTGPGDVALTLAFFEVAKAADPGSGSGIRFTQQEQKLITGARGWADAAQANVERWGKGTLYDDRQREQMAKVIELAAKKSEERQAQIIGATGSLNPRATSVAATAAGAPSPSLSKTKTVQKTRDAQNLNDALDKAMQGVK